MAETFKPILRRPAAAPAQAAPPPDALPDIPGVTGMEALRRLPTQEEIRAAQMGQIPRLAIDPKKLTETERQDYLARGINPDDFPDAAARVAAYMKAVHNTEVPLPVAPTTPPLAMPPIVPIEQASPERQAAMRNIMAGGNAPPQKPFTPVSQVMPPQASATQPAWPAPPMPPAWPPQPPPQPHQPPQYQPQYAPQPPQPQAQTPPFGYSYSAPLPPPPPPPPAPPPPEPKDPHCPKCGHDQRETNLFKPSEADLILFQQCLYSNQRYTASCEVLNGNVKLKFHRMTSREVEMVQAQIVKEGAKDLRENVVRPSLYYQNLSMAYCMTLSLAEMMTPNSHCMIPPIAERVISSAVQDDLVTAYQDLLDNLLQTDDLRRTVYAAYIEFSVKCDRMWEIVSRPDFSNATGLPRY